MRPVASLDFERLPGLDDSVLEAGDVLGNEDWELKYAQVKQVARSNKPTSEILDSLRTFIHDESSSVRYAAVNAIRDLKCKGKSEVLIFALSDPYEWVRIRAIEGLGDERPPEAVELFLQYLDKEDNPKVRATLVKHLGRYQEERLIPIIAHYLEDEDARVRANTVEGLGFYPPELVQEIVRPYLEDENARMRANVAVVLSRSQDKGAQKTLEEMLVSSNPYERMGAIFSLGELRDPAYLPILFESLKDNSFLVQRNVKDALVKYGIMVQGPLLKEIRTKKNYHFILGAISVLTEIGDKKALKTLIKLQESGDGEVREAAERAMDLICDRVESERA